MSPPKMSDQFFGFKDWDRLNISLNANCPWNYIGQDKIATAY